MSDPSIEERLRRGLSAAAAALPEHQPGRRPSQPGHRHRHRVALSVAASVAVVAGVAGAVSVVARDDGDASAVVAGEEATAGDGRADGSGDAPATTVPLGQVPARNGHAPGEAVVVGDEIRLYGPDGEQTGAIDIAPLDFVGDASSDLNGGWVVCGATEGEPDRWMWYPADGEPVVLGGLTDEQQEELDALREQLGDRPWSQIDATLTDEPVIEEDIIEPVPVGPAPPAPCMSGTVQVIDSVRGPVVLGVDGGAWSGEDLTFQATVLATGETYELPVTMPASALTTRVSSATGRLLWVQDGGLRLFDLDTGEELPVADIAVDDWAFVSLAPDAASVAVADGPVDGPAQVTIYDLASGDVLYDESFSLPLEGFQLSYDGDTLAVGGNGPATVVDLASGDRHTIDAHGVLP